MGFDAWRTGLAVLALLLGVAQGGAPFEREPEVDTRGEARVAGKCYTHVEFTFVLVVWRITWAGNVCRAVFLFSRHKSRFACVYVSALAAFFLVICCRSSLLLLLPRRSRGRRLMQPLVTFSTRSGSVTSA